MTVFKDVQLLNAKGYGFIRQEVTQSTPQWREGSPRPPHSGAKLWGLTAEDHSPAPKQGFGQIGEVSDLLFSRGLFDSLIYPLSSELKFLDVCLRSHQMQLSSGK